MDICHCQGIILRNCMWTFFFVILVEKDFEKLIVTANLFLLFASSAWLDSLTCPLRIYFTKPNLCCVVTSSMVLSWFFLFSYSTVFCNLDHHREHLFHSIWLSKETETPSSF